jgi:hypothetical protein
VEKSFSAGTVEKAAGEVWPEEAATEDAMNLLSDFAKRLEEDVVGPYSFRPRGGAGRCRAVAKFCRSPSKHCEA